MADRWQEPFRPELQVKQYVAVVRGAHGRFAVFTTKSGRHYLFAQRWTTCPTPPPTGTPGNGPTPGRLSHQGYQRPGRIWLT